MSTFGVFTRLQLRQRSEDSLRSAITNCICPECGGALRIRKNQYRCQGRCGEDWWPIWNHLFSAELERKIRVKPVSRSARAA
jgi:hypothetical protein